MKIDNEVLEEVYEQLRITYNKNWRDNNELVISITGIRGDNLYTFNVPVAHLDNEWSLVKASVVYDDVDPEKDYNSLWIVTNVVVNPPLQLPVDDSRSG